MSFLDKPIAKFWSSQNGIKMEEMTKKHGSSKMNNVGNIRNEQNRKQKEKSKKTD